MIDDLPSPKAQVQLLPVAILQPAADRIAYMLRRGIDIDLGKEGKKGSASDPLKVRIRIFAIFPFADFFHKGIPQPLYS
jgi:hypothetical protein